MGAKGKKKPAVYEGPRHSFCEVPLGGLYKPNKRGNKGTCPTEVKDEVSRALVPLKAEGTQLVNGFEVRWDAQGLWIEGRNMKTLRDWAGDYYSIAAPPKDQ